MDKFDSLKNEVTAVKLADFIEKILNSEDDIKSISDKIEKNGYIIHNTSINLDGIADELAVFVYIITDKNGNTVIPIQPILYSKNESEVSNLMPEIYKNGLCLSVASGTFKILDLKKKNFDKNNDLIKEAYIYSFDDALVRKKHIFGFIDDKVIVYDPEKRKKLYEFDGFDTEDNHIYGFYQDPDDINHYVRLVFDDEIKLINNEINDVLDDMEVTLIIPKKMNLDKKTVINYAKNIFRDYENLNYIDNEKLLRSGMYLQ